MNVSMNIENATVEDIGTVDVPTISDTPVSSISDTPFTIKKRLTRKEKKNKSIDEYKKKLISQNLIKDEFDEQLSSFTKEITNRYKRPQKSNKQKLEEYKHDLIYKFNLIINTKGEQDDPSDFNLTYEKLSKLSTDEVNEKINAYVLKKKNSGGKE